MKRDNKWMGRREWHARRYTGWFSELGEGQDNLFMLREDD